MTIKKLPAVLKKHLSDADSQFELKENDPRLVIPLSLEYKKKLAKKLLKSLRNSLIDSKDWSRVKVHHPDIQRLTPDKIKLADVQLVIAREAGFSSWATLKHHIQSAQIASESVKAGQASALDGGKKTLHIRCGNDIMVSMAIAGFTGDFLTFADPYILGAVPETQTRDEFIRIRADVLADSFELKQAYQDLSRDYAALEAAHDYERIMLWFEHDAYDVLIFLKLLHFFSESNKRPIEVNYICITHYPGVKRFNGIGQLPAEAMRVLWGQFQAISEAQFEWGKQAWEAFIAPNPKPFYQLAYAQKPVFPAVIPAMQRQLKELPWLQDGLSLTERLTLQILADKGEQSAVNLFFKWHTLHYEPLVFMGDSIYWKVLDHLSQAKYPAITFVKESDKVIEWQVSPTDFGRTLLEGKAHWVESNGYDRWLGGTHNTSKTGCWYWDELRQKVVKID